MANILITEQIDSVGPSLLEKAGHTIIRMETREQSELAEKIKDADAVIVRILDMPAEIISDAPRLKIIAKHGVGLDNIDLNAAKEAGVAVTITPSANSLSVAEHAVSLMLALSKNIPHVPDQYREIGFAAKNCAPGVEVSGKTLGLIGCGQIGSRFAQIAAGGFGMRVLVYDPYISEVPLGCELISDRDRIFKESDFISLHCVLCQETFRSVGQREFDMMKPDAIFINCGRGPLVDESALIRALQDGKIRGAGLDVTEKEPCDPASPLFSMPNVILTPHYAPTTIEAAARVSKIAAENVIAFLGNGDVVGRIV
ncbi:hydroxyacid dehydrogenase [Oscillospiraceae bacterium LTW-04]|nr:hydroxyacid dehydrogenase [Oscillospiraceae bacterium MB24-C1]